MSYNLSESIGFMLNRAQARVRNLFIQRLKEYNITPEQWILFSKISEEEGISPTDLSYITIRDKPYTTRLLDGLEERGAIIREVSPNDKRSSLIFLTKQGAQLKKEILPVVSELNDWITKTMNEEEIKLLKGLLNKLYEHIKEG